MVAKLGINFERGLLVYFVLIEYLLVLGVDLSM